MYIRHFAKIENEVVVDLQISELYSDLPEGEWYETFTHTNGKKFAKVGDSYDRLNNNYVA